MLECGKILQKTKEVHDIKTGRVSAAPSQERNVEEDYRDTGLDHRVAKQGMGLPFLSGQLVLDTSRRCRNLQHDGEHHHLHGRLYYGTTGRAVGSHNISLRRRVSGFGRSNRIHGNSIGLGKSVARSTLQRTSAQGMKWQERTKTKTRKRT